MITEMFSVRRQLVRHRGKTNCTCDRIEAPSALPACHGECRPVSESVGSTCIQQTPSTGLPDILPWRKVQESDARSVTDMQTSLSKTFSQFTVEVRTFVVYLFI